MSDIFDYVVNKDYSSFNDEFKDMLKLKYSEKRKEIEDNFYKNVLSEVTMNVGTKKIKCKNCGHEFLPNIPVGIELSSCPNCGYLNSEV